MPAEEIARRVNAAAKLMASGLDEVAASQRLARRYGVSDRQARRYVDHAVESGAVDIPEAKVVFTVKVPTSLVTRARSHAKRTGETISAVVSQALSEYLDRVRAGRGGGR